MSFCLLAPNLHELASAAEKYFGAQHGATHFKHETAIDPDLPLTPTLSAKLSNGCSLCVEVSERAYSPSLDTFVVECSTRGFPVKLYVVLSSAKGDPEFSANLKLAKARGVGVVALENGAFPASEAVSLSLFGLRKNQIEEFPKSKRDAVRTAEQTFLNGNPTKGCQSLYEEIEAITRAFARRSRSDGWWRSPHSGESKPLANIDTGPWARVLKDLATFLDHKQCKAKCPLICDGLIASAQAVTDPRNLTSHKPSNLKAVIQRDKKLRTWFENSSDVLRNWCDATRPLKL